MVEDKNSAEAKRLQEALEYSDAIIATVREPFVVLDKELRIITANRSFYRTFQVNPEETEKLLIYDLGNRQWDIPGLRKLLAESLREKIENLDIEHKDSKVGSNVTISLGVYSLIPDKNRTRDELIGLSDRALYKAKQGGRNRVVRG